MAIYDKFAKQYSDSMSEEGDYFHQTQIDPYIYEIVGNPKGKVIYDIGCGNGYMARHFAKLGAKVYASDASAWLIEHAREKSTGLDITYSVRDALNFDGFEKSMFDAVVMNMVIHYIKDLDKLFAGIEGVLKEGGIFAFSTNHFFRPDYPRSEWVVGKVDYKDILFIKVTGYLKKEKRIVTSGWDNKTKMALYNHPLNELVNTMSKHSLYTFKVEEPESVGFAKSYSEELQKSHNIPTFITMGARKFS
jgi:2-polyprenyl-3-methyl-5-hydroxy-6-metoxy-1,4-benzoquinol methylase